MKEFKIDTNEKINSGFTIPEDYFESFSEKVTSQLPKVKPTAFLFSSKYITRMYAIAALLLLALFIPIVNQLQNNQSEMSTSEAETFIAQNTSISDDDLVYLLDQEDIDNLQIDSSIEETTLTDILLNNSEIENYITN